MPSPQVTVLMTVYNGMPYLPIAVNSILNQTLRDFRFVIVDDGSTDQTAEYLDSIADDRVAVLHQENGGTAAAANAGLALCETEFVARMDADDVAMRQRLERQRQFLVEHPEVGILGTQVAPLGDRSVGKSLNLPTRHEDIFRAMMTGRHGMAHSSIMMRTELLKSIGGYWKKPLIDDWDMMIRMGEISRMANLDQVLLHYRVHVGSLNGTSMMRMHRHIQYAIDCAKRRQNGQPEREYSEFESQLGQRAWPERFSERLHVYAMTQYRLAVAEIQGRRPLLGRFRLAWAAACSPTRTLQRIRRVLSTTG